MSTNKVLIIIVTLVGKGKIHSKDDSQNNLPKPLKHFVMTITMAVDKFSLHVSARRYIMLKYI